MDEHQPNMPALRREWLAARILGGFGALLLAAVAAVTVLTVLYATPPPAAPATPGAATAPPDTKEARRQEDIALCDAALATVQKIGLLPAFATRDGDAAMAASVQGRYACRAKTDAAKYTITFDLACIHLGAANCIVPVTVAQDGGGVLYQRP